MPIHGPQTKRHSKWLSQPYLVYNTHPETWPKGLIVLLHGGGGSPRAIESESGLIQYFRELSLSSSESLRILVPQGSRVSGIPWYIPNVFDWLPLEKSIEYLADVVFAEIGYSPAKVCYAGYSNGAHLAQCVADRRGADCVVAVCSHRKWEGLVQTESPPTLFVVGTNDMISPFNGGKGIAKELYDFDYPSLREAMLSRMAAPTSRYVWRSDIVNSDSPSLVCLSENTSKQRIRAIVALGCGHSWPGGRPSLDEEVIGRHSTDSVNQHIWDFIREAFA